MTNVTLPPGDRQHIAAAPAIYLRGIRWAPAPLKDRRRRILAVRQPTGSGKSTFLKCSAWTTQRRRNLPGWQTCIALATPASATYRSAEVIPTPPHVRPLTVDGDVAPLHLPARPQIPAPRPTSPSKRRCTEYANARVCSPAVEQQRLRIAQALNDRDLCWLMRRYFSTTSTRWLRLIHRFNRNAAWWWCS